MILAVIMVIGLDVVVFVTVVFVWSLLRIDSICIILHQMGLQLQRLSFPHQLLFNKVVLKIRDAIYYFRVKNG